MRHVALIEKSKLVPKVGVTHELTSVVFSCENINKAHVQERSSSFDGFMERVYRHLIKLNGSVLNALIESGLFQSRMLPHETDIFSLPAGTIMTRLNYDALSQGHEMYDCRFMCDSNVAGDSSDAYIVLRHRYSERAFTSYKSAAKYAAQKNALSLANFATERVLLWNNIPNVIKICGDPIAAFDLIEANRPSLEEINLWAKSFPTQQHAEKMLANITWREIVKLPIKYL